MKCIRLLLVLTIGSLASLATAADNTQIQAGSQAQEWNSYANGGKVVTIPRRSNTGTAITLQTQGGLQNISYPNIVWYNNAGTAVKFSPANGTGTDRPVSTYSWYRFNTPSDFSTLNYYAATWMNGSAPLSNQGAEGKVAYTNHYRIEKFPEQSEPDVIAHTVKAAPGASINLYPTFQNKEDYYYVRNMGIHIEFNPKNFFYTENGDNKNANKGNHLASGQGSDTNNYLFGYNLTAPALGESADVSCYMKYDRVWSIMSTETDKELESWNIKSVLAAPTYTDTIYTNSFEDYSATGSGFGINSITHEWTSNYGLWWGANADRVLPGEYALFSGSMQSVAPRTGSHAVCYGPSNAPQRMFHFVVDASDAQGTHFGANDSLAIGAWFLSRLGTGEARNISIVVSDYTGHVKGREIVTYLSGTIGVIYERQAVAIKVPAGCTSILVEFYNNTLDANLNGDDLYMDDVFVTRREEIYSFRNGFYQLYYTGDNNAYLTASATQTAANVQYDGSTFWYITYEGNTSDNTFEYSLLNLAGNGSDMYFSNDQVNAGTLAYTNTPATLKTAMNVEDYPENSQSRLFLWMTSSSRNLATQSSGNDRWRLESLPNLIVRPTTPQQTHIIYDASTGKNKTSIEIPLTVDAGVWSNMNAGDIEFVFPGNDRPDWLTITVNMAAKKVVLGSSAEDSRLRSSTLEFYIVNKKYPKIEAIDASQVTSPLCRYTLVTRPSKDQWMHLRSASSSRYMDAAKNGANLVPGMDNGQSARQTQDWMNIPVGNRYVILNANGLALTKNGSSNLRLEPYNAASNANQLWELQSVDAYSFYLKDASGKFVYENGNSLQLSNSNKTTFYCAESSYKYTIRIPQGQSGFDLYFHQVDGINGFFVRNTTLGYNYDVNEIPALVGEHATIALPDQGIISTLAPGCYNFTLVLKPSYPNCPCNDERHQIDIRLMVVPDQMTWSGNTSEWVSDEAWSEGSIPLATTDVVIPGDADLFPVLRDSAEYLTHSGIPYRDQHFRLQASARDIHFEDGARMGRTDLLVYRNASYDLSSLKVLKWYNLATPLHQTYSSDYTFRNLNPITEMRVHNYNPTTGTTPASVDWSQSFTTGSVSLENRGFAMCVGAVYYDGMTWGSDDALDYSSMGSKVVLSAGSTIPQTLTMPQSRTEFHHMNASTKHPTGYIEPLGSRSNSGRFVYENSDHSVPEGTLKTFTVDANVQAGDCILLPNIFLSDLDLKKFFETNSGVLENEFYLIGGLKPVYTLYQYNESYDKYISADRSIQLPTTLAPLQSFLAVAKSGAAGKQIRFTADMSTANGAIAPSLRQAGIDNTTALVATITQGDMTAGASLVLDENADTGYLQGEDGRLLLFNGSQAPAIAFMQGNEFLTVDRTASLPSVQPIAVQTLQKGETILSIQGATELADELGRDLYFVDQQTGTRELLDNDEFQYHYMSDGTSSNTRFVIAMGGTGSEGYTQVESAEDSGLTLYTAQGNAYLNAYGTSIRKVTVLNLTGRPLYSANVNAEYTSLPLPDDPIVLVRVETGRETKVFKVIQ